MENILSTGNDHEENDECRNPNVEGMTNVEIQMSKD